MASIFTRIIRGEVPGRVVWRDDRAVAMVDIRPINTGHTLVVPIEEVDHWFDLAPELATHLMAVAQVIGRAQVAAFSPARVGLMIAGFEVPHTHVHVIPMQHMGHLSFASAAPGDPAALDAAAHALRAALRAMGRPEVA